MALLYRINRPLLYQEVVNALYQIIDDQEIKPGDQLPSERHVLPHYSPGGDYGIIPNMHTRQDDRTCSDPDVVAYMDWSWKSGMPLQLLRRGITTTILKCWSLPILQLRRKMHRILLKIRRIMLQRLPVKRALLQRQLII